MVINIGQTKIEFKYRKPKSSLRETVILQVLMGEQVKEPFSKSYII